jgi:hypothetical protein
MVKLRVTDKVNACDTDTDGDRLRAALIAELDRHQSVEISFSGINSVTSSFVNAAFVELLASFSFETIKSRVRITDSTAQINDLIKRRLNIESTRVTRSGGAYSVSHHAV